MSEWSIFLLGLGGLFVVYRLFFAKPRELPSAEGTRRDFPRYFEQLIAAEDAAAFLVIEDKESRDFFQFAKSEEGLEIDFPLVSKRQREREPAVRATAEKLGLAPSKQATGNRSIDYQMGDEPVQIGSRTVTFFAEGLDVSPDSTFVFKWHEVEPK